jgi:hypothetical protein
MIEKTSGCNHMTCNQCKYEFCWVCGGEAGPGSDHFNPYSLKGCGAEWLEEKHKPKHKRKL